MPAKKKSLREHELQGTFRKHRHQERAEKATATGERVVPDWLPARAKPVYAELMQDLPPLNSTDAITLSQVAILKAELMESPESFIPQKHTQLRHLCATVKGWIDDYQSVKPAEKKESRWLRFKSQQKAPNDEYEEFQAKRAAARAEREAMTPEEQAERHRQTVASLTR